MPISFLSLMPCQNRQRRKQVTLQSVHSRQKAMGNLLLHRRSASQKGRLHKTSGVYWQNMPESYYAILATCSRCQGIFKCFCKKPKGGTKFLTLQGENTQHEGVQSFERQRSLRNLKLKISKYDFLKEFLLYQRIPSRTTMEIRFRGDQEFFEFISSPVNDFEQECFVS